MRAWRDGTACPLADTETVLRCFLLDETLNPPPLSRPCCHHQLFFATMSAIMVGVKYKSDSRDRHLHHGNWLLKLGVWILFVALPFLFPNNVVEAYGG